MMQFQDQSSFYLQEAEWLHQNHKPSFKDKLHLSAMSTGVPALCVYTMVCMGDALPTGALEWAAGYPDVVMSCAKIGRLMNDLAGSSKVCNICTLFYNVCFLRNSTDLCSPNIWLIMHGCLYTCSAGTTTVTWKTVWSVT